VRDNPYEKLRYLSEYLLFHYGLPGDLCPWPWVPRQLLRFHTRLRTECLLRPSRSSEATRGLDLGCGVGRFTFELGRVVSRVLGIDSSRSFVQAARRIAKDHELTVQATECGKHFRNLKVRLPAPLRHSKVQFEFDDAIDVAASAKETFHILAAVNLICRLRHPRRFLRQVHRLVVPGGQFLLASPFSWMPEYSTAAEWLTPQEVIELLRPHFRLARSKSLPFVIREHRRKFQLVVSEVLVFVRGS